MDFCKSKTKQNLAKAFAGESQARGRYAFIAERLREQGQYETAKILTALADNELAHSKVFYDHITNMSQEVVENIEITAGYPFKFGGIVESLNYAVEDEIAEFENIYPAFAKEAEKEGFSGVARSFTQIAAIEKLHGNLLGEIAMKMDTDMLYKSNEKRVFKCSNCGFETESKEAWQVCPVCSHPQGFVELSLQNKV